MRSVSELFAGWTGVEGRGHERHQQAGEPVSVELGRQDASHCLARSEGLPRVRLCQRRIRGARFTKQLTIGSTYDGCPNYKTTCEGFKARFICKLVRSSET